MIDDFIAVVNDIQLKLAPFQTVLMELDVDTISSRKNSQNRSIKQIIGHMIDSASNNTHRIIHLQYREGPVDFPNYATFGNNDKWIAIQNYQEENWYFLVDLWKFTHLHIVHVIKNIDPAYLKNEWISGPGNNITREEMVLDFPRHFDLHIAEIEELMNQNTEDTKD